MIGYNFEVGKDDICCHNLGAMGGKDKIEYLLGKKIFAAPILEVEKVIFVATILDTGKKIFVATSKQTRGLKETRL